MYSWSSWKTLVPLTLGSGILAITFVYERFVAKEPFMPLSMFTNRSVCIGYILTSLHAMLLWCALFYMPLYFEAVQGYSPLMSGVALLPGTATVAPMAVISGILITRTRRYMWCSWIGWTITTFGLGLGVLYKVNSTVPEWFFISFSASLGIGMLFPALQYQVLAASAASKTNMASTIAMFSFFRACGQTLGVAIGGTIFQNRILHALEAHPALKSSALEFAKDAAALVETVRAMPDGNEKLIIQTAYTDAIRTIYIFLCTTAAVALVMCAFVKSYDVDVGIQTEHGLEVEKNTQGSS